MTKKAYVKPSLEIEKFMASTSVAVGCQREVSSTTTTYEACEIDCVISTSDWIFNSGNSDCTTKVTVGGVGSNWFFANYNGQLYFCWKSSSMSSGTPPDATQTAELLKILQAGDSTMTSGQGWHAGPVDLNKCSSVNTLYKSSY